MKKKILVLLTATMMSVCMLTGCGETDKASDEAVVKETEVKEVAEDKEDAEEADTEEEETEEVAEEPTEEPEQPAKPEPAPAPEQPAEQEPAYTYADISATKYAKSSVNVRSLPSTDGERVGGLSTNQSVTVTGQCNETGWYRIDYNGTVAYVSNNYLVDDKVETQTQASTASTSTDTGSSSSAGTDNSSGGESEKSGEALKEELAATYAICPAGHDTSKVYNAYVGTYVNEGRDGLEYAAYYYDYYENSNCVYPNGAYGYMNATNTACSNAIANGIHRGEHGGLTLSREQLDCGCILCHAIVVNGDLW